MSPSIGLLISGSGYLHNRLIDLDAD